MVSFESQVSLAEIIAAINTRQPVLNEQKLTNQQLTVSGIGSLNDANAQQLSFLTDKAYASALPTSQAAIILVAEAFADQVPDSSVAVIVANPYAAYASVTHLFDPQPDAANELFIHPTAQIADTAVLGDNVHIGPFCVIGEQVQIGTGTQLKSQVHIEAHAQIGEHCVIYPNVFIGHRCQIGNRARLYPGASIGSEGFGFAPLPPTDTQGWERIVQLGRVIIGNQVRVGSHTCIDRGAIGDTVIGDNVIIDNLVQVGHNVKIGAGTAIAGNAGIAGSTSIGKRCMIGGNVGISGHINICDDVALSGMTMVIKSIKQAGVYSSGLPAMPAMDWRRMAVKVRALGKKEG
ncbi:UDP-3-O-(3-hydroxymyristoyl)glucosamine N-acyltransferase [Psychrobacter sp. FDAARGOS_221]|uniref:UDP-3-O-(3-hydroxymyristoyl)glucosamine N-acyltransferase n=1 Tax=Psychrobacter sp. FDAARGOS_221 TaxID=1975705 RepID=UPI000BB54DB3|nr:UDP-3-O-(3-hydroxymyristoyl)glucosamine N-acyltransferase [Psychrobacter sp. FDAARGOS_221]PNK61376.1 UDP-3-O-(3-hydroxymyristoyl)glucosamine N-acyltransferase [Psychrobacter sp. FDAARGOS_221]